MGNTERTEMATLHFAHLRNEIIRTNLTHTVHIHTDPGTRREEENQTKNNIITVIVHSVCKYKFCFCKQYREEENKIEVQLSSKYTD